MKEVQLWQKRRSVSHLLKKTQNKTKLIISCSMSKWNLKQNQERPSTSKWNHRNKTKTKFFRLRQNQTRVWNVSTWAATKKSTWNVENQNKMPFESVSTNTNCGTSTTWFQASVSGNGIQEFQMPVDFLIFCNNSQFQASLPLFCFLGLLFTSLLWAHLFWQSFKCKDLNGLLSLH